MNNKAKYICGRVFGYIRPYRMQIFLIVIFSALESGLFVFAPKLAGNTLNLLANITAENQKTIFSDILKNIMILFSVYSGYAFSSAAISYFGNLISVRVTYKLRKDISSKLNNISFSYVNLLSKGDILSRVVNDVENLTDGLKDGIQRLVSSLVVSVGILVMMFTISVKMTIITLILLFVTAVFSAIIVKCSKKYYKKYQETLGSLNDTISETFRGYDVIKTMGSEKYFSAKFDSINKGLYECAWNSQFISGLASPIIEIVSNVNYVIVCVMGAYMVLAKNFTVGDISAFIAYSGQISGPLTQFAGLFGMLQQTFVSAERIFEILDAPEEQTLLYKANAGVEFTKSIVMEDIDFEYEVGKNILNKINLEIPKGKTIALVGKTGSGKTTLINVLMRFYNAKSGRILLDGKNINEVSSEGYRSLFGLVSQDVWLYNGTILENIRYGNLKANDADIKKVAEHVGIHHFIESLPDGYNTEINEYTDNISQGQRQLISFARMMISNAQILIMDEATALVDSGTEEKIQSSINKFLKDKTMIIIAHRLSTVENADMIVVFDEGKIVEKGSHSELLAKDGVYSKLYNSQFLNI